MVEIIIGTVFFLGIGIGIWCYGLWIGKQQNRPIGFWANGKRLDEKSAQDITGYNKAYGKLFCIYSIPVSCAGVLMFLSAFWRKLDVVSLIVLILWGSVGLCWLILGYKKIENQYISR